MPDGIRFWAEAVRMLDEEQAPAEVLIDDAG